MPVLYGTNLDDILYGPNDGIEFYAGAGDDQIYAGVGADYLDGSLGADYMRGGLGDDVYIVDDIGDYVVEDSAGGTDTVVSSVSYALRANVETLYLSGALHLSGYGNSLANTLIGNSGSNSLYGDDGDDTLLGYDGQDTLDGGAGLDRMVGGRGDDVYFVDNANDWTFETAGEGYDAVYSSVNYALGADIEALILTGQGNLIAQGNALSNYLQGNAGANVLYGGAGFDLMFGGLGDDTYSVDSAYDQVVEASGEGVDTVVTTVDYVLPNHVENLIGDTPFAASKEVAIKLSLYGNALDNVIVGGGGGGWIYGGDGNDVLISKAFDVPVYLYGGDGDDVMQFIGRGSGAAYGGLGDDMYYTNMYNIFIELDGEGIDAINASSGGWPYTMGPNIENLVGGNGSGNSLNNNMSGSVHGNFLDGNLGNDTIAGLDGDDSLNGGWGDDWLVGGQGEDSLFGDLGADRFVFADGDLGSTRETADWIHDFDTSDRDRIDLTRVDANQNVVGDQAFAYIGEAGFSGVAGQLRFEMLDGSRYFQADVDGDGAVDFWLRVGSTRSILVDDFLL